MKLRLSKPPNLVPSKEYEKLFNIILPEHIEVEFRRAIVDKYGLNVKEDNIENLYFRLPLRCAQQDIRFKMEKSAKKRAIYLIEHGDDHIQDLIDLRKSFFDPLVMAIEGINLDE